MDRAAILSTGSYLPPTFLHNEELNQFPDTSKLMVSQKTGVFARRQAKSDQCTSDLAHEAARCCLTRIGFDATDIDGIIVSTSSPDRMQPATATRVQHLLGAEKAFAFDINSVCSGSTYGIALADAMVRSGLCRHLLFVAAEVYSRILNPKDFSTFPFFGDGAGAILFGPGDKNRGVLHSCLGTDGRGAETICVPAGGTMMPFVQMKRPNLAYFKMKGKDVFAFATAQGTKIIQRLLCESGVTREEVRCFVCHQANFNIIAQIAERIEIPIRRFFINLFRYGNTASASVPIALDEAISQKVLHKNDLAVTVAFGGGLSWGANLIRI